MRQAVFTGMYMLMYFSFTRMSPSGENEGMPGGIGVTNVLTVAVQGNWHYS